MWEREGCVQTGGGRASLTNTERELGQRGLSKRTEASRKQRAPSLMKRVNKVVAERGESGLESWRWPFGDHRTLQGDLLACPSLITQQRGRERYR